MVQTSETLVKSYSIEELNQRYLDKPWLNPFDINSYDFTPRLKSKKSKLTNGYLLNPDPIMQDKEPEITQLSTPIFIKIESPIKKDQNLMQENQNKLRKHKSVKDMTPEEKDVFLKKKRDWVNRNKEKVNARRRFRYFQQKAKKNGISSTNDFPRDFDTISIKELFEKTIEFRYFDDKIPVKLIITPHLLKNKHSDKKWEKMIESIKDYLKNET